MLLRNVMSAVENVLVSTRETPLNPQRRTVPYRSSHTFCSSSDQNWLEVLQRWCCSTRRLALPVSWVRYFLINKKVVLKQF